MSAIAPATPFLKKWLRPLVALVLLVFVLKSGVLKIEQLKSVLSDQRVVMVGILLLTLQFFLYAIRWKIILAKIIVVPLQRVLKYQCIGQFFNLFVPGGVGGDVIKALEVAKTEKISRHTTMTSVLIDRILGLYCMIIFSFLFLIIEYKYVENQYLVISSALMLVSTAGLLFSQPLLNWLLGHFKKTENKIIKKLETFLATLSEGLHQLLNPRSFLKVLSISFIAQIFAITFMYYVTMTLASASASPSYFLYFPLACFAFMASSIPITPGGIGLGQAAFYFVFLSLGKDIANSAVIGISLMQLFGFLIGLPGAYFFTRSPKS